MKRVSLLDVPINKPVPYEKNPRFNEKAVPRVMKSLVEFGYVKVSIGIDENWVLLYGHTTLKSFEALSHLPKEQWGKIVDPHIIPEVTQIFDLTEEQKRGYRIADNKTSEYAGWDFVKLIDEMVYLQDQGVEGIIDATGFGMLTEEETQLKEAFDGEFKSKREIGQTVIKCPSCGFEFTKDKMNINKGTQEFGNEH